jgi:hypothetical protein
MPIGGFVVRFWLNESAWQSAPVLRGAAGEVIMATADELATPPYEYEVRAPAGEGEPQPVAEDVLTSPCS